MTSQPRDKTRDSTKHDTAKFGLDLYYIMCNVYKKQFFLQPDFNFNLLKKNSLELDKCLSSF